MSMDRDKVSLIIGCWHDSAVSPVNLVSSSTLKISKVKHLTHSKSWLMIWKSSEFKLLKIVRSNTYKPESVKLFATWLMNFWTLSYSEENTSSVCLSFHQMTITWRRIRLTMAISTGSKRCLASKLSKKLIRLIWSMALYQKGRDFNLLKLRRQKSTFSTQVPMESKRLLMRSQLRTK